MPAKTSIVALVAATVSAELSIKTASQRTSAAQTLAGNLMNYYTSTNGLLPYPPYFAWESAGMWSSMIGYSVYTNDSTYTSAISTDLFAQAGPTLDFSGANTPGNDDQLWWGLAAMSAAEAEIPPPPSTTWDALASTVFEAVIARWDNSTCSGGLHWQIDPAASGYSYKNSITNSLAFQLAVRLSIYTNDSKYTTWAETIFDWMLSVNLIDKTTYAVYDGTDSKNNCADLNHDLWSYNVATPMYGVALLSLSSPDKWTSHLDGFISAAQTSFTTSSTLTEKCESTNTCNSDQLSFKAYLSRWLAEIAALIPSTQEKILPMLGASVDGALASCNGGPQGSGCGVKWTTGSFDGSVGVGQQMSALEIVLGDLVVKKVGEQGDGEGRSKGLLARSVRPLRKRYEG